MAINLDSLSITQSIDTKSLGFPLFQPSFTSIYLYVRYNKFAFIEDENRRRYSLTPTLPHCNAQPQPQPQRAGTTRW